MSYDTLIVSMAHNVATCTFHRPQRKNALNEQMVRELLLMLEELAADNNVRVVIFTGSDKVFVSGADIAELKDRTSADALRRINTQLFFAIEQFPKPTLAAVRGFALGGGCELAMACDVRIAGSGAKLGQPEVTLGIVPGAGATYRLPRLVGPGWARELIFTGRVIDAELAERIGLVNRVVPDDDVLSTAQSLAEQMAQNSALALRLAKQSLNLAPELSGAAAMALESTAQAVLFDDAEKMARMTAFIERKSKGGA